jgi:hypothetical protein
VGGSTFWQSKTTWAAIVGALIAGLSAYLEKVDPLVALIAALAFFQQAFFRETTVKNTERIERSNNGVALAVEEAIPKAAAAAAETVKNGSHDMATGEGPVR